MPDERKNIGEVLAPRPFYPDLPKQPRDVIIGLPFVFYDWVIVKDWESSTYGSSSFALVALGELDSKKPTLTSLVSGVAVLKKLAKLRSMGIKEIKAQLVKKETKAGNEMYDLVDV